MSDTRRAVLGKFGAVGVDWPIGSASSARKHNVDTRRKKIICNIIIISTTRLVRTAPKDDVFYLFFFPLPLSERYYSNLSNVVFFTRQHF